MKNIPLHPFSGLSLDKPGRFEDPTLATRAVNVLFRDGCFYRRGGLSRIGSNGPFPDKVLAVACYDPFFDVQKHLLAFTKRDIYLYDANTEEWSFVTPRYYAGQASCAGSTTAVVGNTTAWSNSWPAAVYQIKFGTQDPNGVGTPDEWYTIASFTDATHLVLSGDGPNTSGDVNYVIRMCLSGGDDNFPSITQPVSGSTYEKTVVMTNYVDMPVIWEGVASAGIGDGFFRALGGSPNRAKYAATAGARTLLAWFNDSGTEYPQGVMGSARADAEDWSEDYKELLVETEDEITAIVPFGTGFLVYKEDSVTPFEPTYQEDGPPYSFYENRIPVGTPCGRSVAELLSLHVFKGVGGFYATDGSSPVSIGDKIDSEINERINTDRIGSCFSVADEDCGLYIFMYPKSGDEDPRDAAVYNAKEKSWTTWEMKNALTCGGVYYRQDPLLTLQDLIDRGDTYNDLMGTRLRDLLDASPQRRIVFGGADGYVYEYHEGHDTDSGLEIEAVVETVDHPMNDIKSSLLFKQIILGMRGEPSGNVAVQVSLDGGYTWSGDMEVNAVGVAPFIERVIWCIKKGKRARVRFKNVNGSNFKVESMVLGYEDGGVELRG